VAGVSMAVLQAWDYSSRPRSFGLVDLQSSGMIAAHSGRLRREVQNMMQCEEVSRWMFSESLSAV